MTKVFCLDATYSTTRLLIREQPHIGSIFESMLALPEGEGRKDVGGLRRQGFYKTSQINKPLITIVTVVYNGEQFLAQTIQSILNQTYDKVEYIIIDGGSTDGTLSIIKKYEHAIDYWASERDEGIYDAMNKGIDLVSGTWINFMNCGDCFYNSSVIGDIFSQNKSYDADVIFGHHNVVYTHKTKLVKSGDVRHLWKGSQFCHQSSFVKSSAHKEIKFNSLNRIGGDFEFFYKAYRNQKHFKCKDLLVSSITAGGLSDLNRVECIVGWWNVVEKNSKVNFYYIYRVLIEMTKSCIKKIL